MKLEISGIRALLLVGAIGGAAALASSCGGSSNDSAALQAEQAARVEQGKRIFRFDTFGDEIK